MNMKSADKPRYSYVRNRGLNVWPELPKSHHMTLDVLYRPNRSVPDYCLRLMYINQYSELLRIVLLDLHGEDRLCGAVVRVPGYITEMYCVSCEVRTEFIYVM
jgi:hypothetical protein